MTLKRTNLRDYCSLIYCNVLLINIITISNASLMHFKCTLNICKIPKILAFSYLTINHSYSSYRHKVVTIYLDLPIIVIFHNYTEHLGSTLDLVNHIWRCHSLPESWLEGCRAQGTATRLWAGWSPQDRLGFKEVDLRSETGSTQVESSYLRLPRTQYRHGTKLGRWFCLRKA